MSSLLGPLALLLLAPPVLADPARTAAHTPEGTLYALIPARNLSGEPFAAAALLPRLRRGALKASCATCALPVSQRKRPA